MKTFVPLLHICMCSYNMYYICTYIFMYMYMYIFHKDPWITNRSAPKNIEHQLYETHHYLSQYSIGFLQPWAMHHQLLYILQEYILNISCHRFVTVETQDPSSVFFDYIYWINQYVYYILRSVFLDQRGLIGAFESHLDTIFFIPGLTPNLNLANLLFTTSIGQLRNELVQWAGNDLGGCRLQGNNSVYWYNIVDLQFVGSR